MLTFSQPEELSELLKNHQLANEKIGFVPTMGALHEGHSSLIRRSVSENKITVVSIFINRIQFNNEEDYTNYPIDLDGDLKYLEGLNVDYVFIPSEEQLYPQKPIVSISFGPLSEIMEGEFRAGHFEGVGLVVSKLLNIIKPDRAYFGLKDLQQYLLIKTMCRDLNFSSEIIGVETMREPNGLAMSSRNRRLSKSGMEIASNLFKGLILMKKDLANEFSIIDAKTRVKKYYSTINGLDIEYLEVIDPEKLAIISTSTRTDELAICVAGYVEGLRLIDNLYLRLN